MKWDSIDDEDKEDFFIEALDRFKVKWEKRGIKIKRVEF